MGPNQHQILRMLKLETLSLNSLHENTLSIKLDSNSHNLKSHYFFLVKRIIYIKLRSQNSQVRGCKPTIVNPIYIRANQSSNKGWGNIKNTKFYINSTFILCQSISTMISFPKHMLHPSARQPVQQQPVVHQQRRISCIRGIAGINQVNNNFCI